MRTLHVSIPIGIAIAFFATVASAAPITGGWLDGADARGGAGWAYDPARGAQPVSVEVWVDGGLVTTVTANGSRPDLVSAGAAPEAEHGFSFTLPGLAPGSHAVETYGLFANGRQRLSGSPRTVTVAAAPMASARGHLDTATPAVATGWAYDPTLGAAALTVHIHADGRFLVAAVANGPRSDLVTAGVAKEPEHGFSASLAGLAPGPHTIDAYAVTPLGDVKLIGSGKTVTIAAAPMPSGTTPIGVLDEADATRGAAGWAYDPVAGAAPVVVHIYVDGALFGATTADRPRPDLVTAGVAKEPNHGFVASLAGLAPGRHRVEVFAIARVGNNPKLDGSEKLVVTPRVPMPGAPTVRTGMVEMLSPDGVLSGTAFDPVEPALTVKVYADGPPGQGRLVGTTLADGAEPSPLGTLTRWRWVAPPSLRDGKPHVLRAYATDLAGKSTVELAGTKTLVASPVAIGDLVLRGREVTISTSRTHAGAVTGLTWNGLQFVNNDDHGRQIQVAWTTGYGERFNPTEAGGSADGASNATRSILLEANVTGTTLSTRSHPSYWVLPNATSPNFGGVGVLASLNGSEVAPDVFAKRVTVDVAGDPHLIRWESELTLFADTPRLFCEAPTPYVDDVFSEYYTWDPATGVLAPIGHSPAGPDGWFKPTDEFGVQALPIVLATANGSHAIGIYSAEANASYGRFDFRAIGGTSKSTLFIQREQVKGGVPLTLVSYLAVGNLDQVRAALALAAKSRP